MTARDGAGEAGDEPIPEEEQQELIQELEHKRTLRGWMAVAVSLIAVLFSAFQMWLAARGFVFEVTLPVVGQIQLAALQLLQINAIHVCFALVLTFLLFPPTTGDGFLSRRLGRVVPGLRDRFGSGNPVTRIAEGGREVFRWLFVDPERRRVTPVDAVLVLFSGLAAAYMITDFDEIRQMRALGLQSGRTIDEVYPFLDPVTDLVSLAGVPLNESSYAFVLGAIGVLLVLEATRRALGLYLMLIVTSFIVYARWGYLIPLDAPYIGVLSITPLGWDSIVQNLWYNTENGVFGIPVTVSVRFIYIFILFGAFLEMSGAGQWFIDLAYSATGERRGGPAKASIIASGFMGTISGSSIANTVTTGAFTIPLMKRSGYSPEFSGAVEASASSGGQILPPVMGAAAFLIVEYTLTPFRDVIMAAAIPAVVFFFGVWVMVDLEASKRNIGGLTPDELVAWRPHMLRGWFYLVPLFLLLYYLIVARLSVARSAWFTLVAISALIALVAAYDEDTRWPLLGTIVGLFALEAAALAATGGGIVAAATGDAPGAGMAPVAAILAAAGKLGWMTLAVSLVTMFLRPSMDAPLLDFDAQVDSAVASAASALRRPRLADAKPFQYVGFVLKSMDAGARTATTVVIAVAAAGIIPGIISVSGLGPNLTSLIRTVAGGSIVILLVLTAVSSIILGMGMPTTVTYIILVSMLGPAITEIGGIPILAAHLFILYFGVIADITPPVAVAAYAASGIAKSDQFDTGVKAFSLSLNKAIVPFAFVLTPGILLLRGTGTGEEVAVIGFSDVADLGYFVPEVVVPVIGVFVGVVALGATIIAYLYTDVGRLDRTLFAFAALLLMAPLLLFNAVNGVLTALDLVGNLDPGVFDLLLRTLGGLLFGALVLRNRRRADTEAAAERGEATEAA